MVVPNTPTHHRGGVGVEREPRPQRAQRHLTPGHVDGEQHRRVGQQRKGQPLQEVDVAVIGDEHLQQQRQQHEEQRHQAAIEAGDQLADLAHGRDVGGDVEGVGDQQQQHDAVQHDRRERRLDVGGEAFAGDPADARADRLDRRHQRKGQRHGPQHVEAELRAGLRIGGDAAGIVVRHAGDQPRPDARQRMLLEALPGGPQRARTGRSADFIAGRRDAAYFQWA